MPCHNYLETFVWVKVLLKFMESSTEDLDLAVLCTSLAYRENEGPYAYIHYVLITICASQYYDIPSLHS